MKFSNYLLATHLSWIEEKYWCEALELFGLCLEDEIQIYYWYISVENNRDYLSPSQLFPPRGVSKSLAQIIQIFYKKIIEYMYVRIAWFIMINFLFIKYIYSSKCTCALAREGIWKKFKSFQTFNDNLL